MSTHYEWFSSDCLTFTAKAGDSIPGIDITGEAAIIFEQPYNNGAIIEGNRADLIKMLKNFITNLERQ